MSLTLRLWAGLVWFGFCLDGVVVDPSLAMFLPRVPPMWIS